MLTTAIATHLCAWAAALLVACGSASTPGSQPAEASDLSVEDIAQALARRGERNWVGARATPILSEPRPVALASLPSPLAPVTVHRSSLKVEGNYLPTALRVLETSRGKLNSLGWGLLSKDGYRGGSGGFDLYLVDDASSPVLMRTDGRLLSSYHDAVTAFAKVDATLPLRRFEACVARAYSEAVLLSWDPAESNRWRRATAEWLTKQVVGQHCEPPTTRGVEGQTPVNARFIDFLESRLPPLESPGQEATGDSLSAIQTAWTLARQRTWNGDRFRASPNLMEVLELWSQLHDSSLDTLFTSFGVETALLGSKDDGVAAGIPWPAQPHHFGPTWPLLEPYGSLTFRVKTRDAPAGSVLRVWLVGEYPSRWVLSAIRVNAAGNESSRMEAAPRDRNPRSFLPIHLEADTAEVIVVVTHLGFRRPELDVLEIPGRTFRLTVAGSSTVSNHATPAAGSDLE